MSHGNHRDSPSHIVDLVNDSVGPSPRGPEALEFEAEWLAYPARVRGNCRKRLDDRGCRGLRQPVQAPSRRTGDDDSPGAARATQPAFGG